MTRRPGSRKGRSTLRGSTTPAARAEALRAEIRRHDERYYVQNRPAISDAAYDRLVARLRAIELAHPEVVTADSPTRRVAGRVAGPFASVHHAAPMLSLEATRDTRDVAAFVKRVAGSSTGKADLIFQPKLDGLSVEVAYSRGRLTTAATRGDGVDGEDVLANARTIESIPAALRRSGGRTPEYLSIRGEVMMPRSAFARLNRELTVQGEEPFANPRNAAAGSLRQLDPNVTAGRGLRFVAYEVLSARGFAPTRDREVLSALRQWGFTVPVPIGMAHGLSDVERYHRRLAGVREQLDYEIDGIVVKSDRLDARSRLGATSHHPRWALAYKFAPRSETTIVDDVVFQVGRTGVLTPVALLRPVDVGGVTVSRATLHNLDELARRDVCIGDAVRVHRAGDVIPEIVERRRGTNRRAVRLPGHCPACHAKLSRDGPFLRCPNRWDCPAQLIASLVHSSSDEAFSIPGLGVEVARRLVDTKLVRRLPDLFTLQASDLRRLPGFARQSAANLADAIARARRIDLARFLVALGTPRTGRTTARALADEFGSLEAIRRAGRAAIDAVPGIGPADAAALSAFMHDRRTAAFIDAFLRAGVSVVSVDRGHRASPLAGKRVAFTGTLPMLGRAEATRLAEDAGAHVTDAVSSHVDYLIAGRSAGEKLARARRAGVPVIGERDFRQLIGETNGRAPRRRASVRRAAVGASS